MRLAPGIAIAATVLALGCGSEEPTESAKRFRGEKQKVAQVVEEFESASRDGDAEKVCEEIFAERGRPGSCEKDLKAFTERAASKKVYLDVKSVDVRGGKASARVTVKSSGSPVVTTYPFVREGSDWRISAAGRN
jgi:hypothetical protein